MIDQKLEDAYFDHVMARVRRGIIDCEEPREDESYDAFMLRKLSEQESEVPE